MANKYLFNLADGRQMCFQEYGDLDGFPVIYCHGFPASRLEAALIAKSAQSQGIRLIAADRPGMGLSSFCKNRIIPDWKKDLEQLISHLKIKQFSIIGVSGGAPYALSAAYQIQDCVYKVGIVCGLRDLHESVSKKDFGFSESLLINLMYRFPIVTRQLYRFIIGPILKRSPKTVLKILTGSAAQSDMKIFDDQSVLNHYLKLIREAFRQGARGVAWELYLYTHYKVDFLQDYKGRVSFWHGRQDKTVPVTMTEKSVSEIKNCQSYYFENEGHFSLGFHYMDRILADLKPK